jgi:uncharacterized membrane protein YphA (DoxX/SURF4 family)
MLESRVPARPVKVVRVCLGMAALITVLELYMLLTRIADGRLAMPLFEGLPAPSDGVALVFMALSVSAAVFVVAGVATRPASLALASLLTMVLLWEQQAYSSHLLLVILLLCYLAFAHADRGAGTVPWWPQLLMMTQASVLYLFAGLSKWNPIFLSGEPMEKWFRWPMPDWVWGPMAVATVVTEVSLAVALWVPRVRWVAVFVGSCLHVSIVVFLASMTLQLVAFALATVPLYGLFLTRPPLGTLRVAARGAEAQPHQA